MILSFTITGPPRTKKTSNRIVRCGKFHKVLPSLAFIEWNKSAQLQLAKAKADYEGLPITLDVNCNAWIYREALRGDAVGYYQAIADALQEAGIVKNDAQIISWNGSQLDKDAKRPRIEVELEF